MTHAWFGRVSLIGCAASLIIWTAEMQSANAQPAPLPPPSATAPSVPAPETPPLPGPSAGVPSAPTAAPPTHNPPAPAPAARQPYGADWPREQQIPPYLEEPVQEKDKGVPLRGLVFVPRIGLIIGGSGTQLQKCAGASLPGQPTIPCEEKEYSNSLDDKSSPAFGFDMLGHASRGLRLGLSALWVPSTNFGTLNAGTTMGSDLSVLGVIEGVVPASKHLRVALRADAGMIKLFPGGPYQDSIDDAKRVCASGGCTVDEPSHVGFTCGAGPGLIFPLDGLNLRTDILYQAWWMNLAASSTSTTSYTRSIAADRVMLMLGMELGL